MIWIIKSAFSILCVILLLKCGRITDDIYREFNASEINNDSIYNILINKSHNPNDLGDFITLRDSVKSFERILVQELDFIDSINLKLKTSKEQRQALVNHFESTQSPLKIRKLYDFIKTQLTKIDSSININNDSIRVGDMPLNLQKMNLIFELESIKTRERNLILERIQKP